MTGMTGSKGAGGWVRPLGWSLAAGSVLLPLLAMQFTAEVEWTFGDFLFAALVIGAVGIALEVAVRVSGNWLYRAGAAVGLGTAFLLTWANAAVGYIGDDNPYNIVFFGVVLLAFAGCLLARMRAPGMALAMLVAGVAHAVAGAIGFPSDPVTGPITILFVGMWLTSAALFHKAAREEG